MFAYRTVDGATGEVSEQARMHAAGVTLEYPMSATAKGDDVILSSWFTGTVQVLDRKTGATKEMMHGFKAPHDAIRLDDGSILVNELGSKSLIRASGEHGKDRMVLIGGLEGPVEMCIRDSHERAHWRILTETAKNPATTNAGFFVMQNPRKHWSNHMSKDDLSSMLGVLPKYN